MQVMAATDVDSRLNVPEEDSAMQIETTVDLRLQTTGGSQEVIATLHGNSSLTKD
jgi:hypothetical protein